MLDTIKALASQVHHRGYTENMGQAEYRAFRAAVNADPSLLHAEKAQL